MHKKLHLLFGFICFISFISLSIIVYLNFQNGPLIFSSWLDESLLQNFIIDQRTKLLTDIFKSYTLIFGPLWGIASALLIALLILIFKKKSRWITLLYFLVIVLSSVALNMGLKLLIHRERPDLVPLTTETSLSFPSGHTIFATVIIWSLLLIICSQIKSTFLKFFLTFIALILIFLVMISRVYLGVHYPSDTLAGFLLGLSILHLSYPLFYKLSHPFRGRHQRY
ncbi:MAG: phosphatase PAP2 family protein [Lactovum sp.]